jgi:hypothetical protein
MAEDERVKAGVNAACSSINFLLSVAYRFAGLPELLFGGFDYFLHKKVTIGD